VFAYNLIRRGWRYGLRIVGSLKSQPALNVLAIYDKISAGRNFSDQVSPG